MHYVALTPSHLCNPPAKQTVLPQVSRGLRSAVVAPVVVGNRSQLPLEATHDKD